MNRRHAAGVMAGATLAVSLTGCQGDTGKAAGGRPSASHGGVQPVALRALGDAATKTGRLTSYRADISSTSSMSGQTVHTTGRVLYRLRPDVAMKLDRSTMTMNGKRMPGPQEVILHDVMYVKAVTAPNNGRPWVKIPLSRLNKLYGMDVQALVDQSSQANPAENARMLTASKDVREVGAETVAGVPTTHYRGTFLVSDAVAKLTDPRQRQSMTRMVNRLGIHTLAFDVWLDRQGLPRKTMTVTPADAKVRTTATVVYTGFDIPVSIKAPPASQVVDGRHGAISPAPGIPG
jgi:hypothetical protein